VVTFATVSAGNKTWDLDSTFGAVCPFYSFVNQIEGLLISWQSKLRGWGRSRSTLGTSILSFRINFPSPIGQAFPAQLSSRGHS